MVYLSQPPRCGRTAVSDLTRPRHLLSSGKFSSPGLHERTVHVIGKGEQHPATASVCHRQKHYVTVTSK